MAKVKFEIKRVRGRGSVEEAQRIAWQALKSGEYLLLRAVDDAGALKAIHAIVQCVGAYVKIVETVELSRRVEELEKSLGR